MDPSGGAGGQKGLRFWTWGCWQGDKLIYLYFRSQEKKKNNMKSKPSQG